MSEAFRHADYEALRVLLIRPTSFDRLPRVTLLLYVTLSAITRARGVGAYTMSNTHGEILAVRVNLWARFLSVRPKFVAPARIAST